MNVSDAGVRFVRDRERCELVAYLDRRAVPPVWTIGCGMTGPGIVEHLVWTASEERARFDARMQMHCAQLSAQLLQPVTQAQFDALVSLTWNIGLGQKGFAGSTLRSKLNAGDLPGAAREFTRWCHTGHLVDEDLLHRRTAELVMFCGW